MICSAPIHISTSLLHQREKRLLCLAINGLGNRLLLCCRFHMLQFVHLCKNAAIKLCISLVVLFHLLFQQLVLKFHIPGSTNKILVNIHYNTSPK